MQELFNFEEITFDRLRSSIKMLPYYDSPVHYNKCYKITNKLFFSCPSDTSGGEVCAFHDVSEPLIRKTAWFKEKCCYLYQIEFLDDFTIYKLTIRSGKNVSFSARYKGNSLTGLSESVLKSMILAGIRLVFEGRETLESLSEKKISFDLHEALQNDFSRLCFESEDPTISGIVMIDMPVETV